MNKLRLRLAFLATLATIAVSVLVQASQPLGSGGINAPEQIAKPTVLMISIDGFRYDYLDSFNPPNLNAIANAGIRAESMQPSFPSLTFPNHITLVTGRYPGNHGIVSNTFYDKLRKEKYSIADSKTVNDGSWYLSDALWTVAEKNHMVTGIMFWVGCEANIGGAGPTYFEHYRDDYPNEDRVKRVEEWLLLPEEKRPHLLGLYFSDVDTAGHKFGTDAPETRDAVLSVDTMIGELDHFIEEHHLPVNIIVVSDHGMRNLETEKIVEIGRIIDLSKFTIGDKGAVMNLYSESASDVDAAYQSLKAAEKNYRVYRRAEVPAVFHYSHPDKVGDLVVVADIPYYLLDQVTAEKPLRLNKATHGWDPREKDMGALFIAKGPQILPSGKIPAFENVHVFPFVLQLLRLDATGPIDGDPAVLKPYVR